MPANQHCPREGEGCPFGFIWSLLPHCIMRASEVGWPVCPSSSEPVTGKLGREDQASSEAIVGKHVLHKESSNRYSVPGGPSSGSLPAVHQYPVFSFFFALATLTATYLLVCPGLVNIHYWLSVQLLLPLSFLSQNFTFVANSILFLLTEFHSILL